MAKQKLIFDEGRIIACTDYTAQYFGVTAQTLSNWAKAGCPQHSYGYWDIRAVTEYRQAIADQRAMDEAESGDLDKLSIGQQKTYFEGKLKAAQLESAEFRNAINRGDYLLRQQVVSDTKQMLLALKRSIQGLGRRIAQEAAGYLDPTQARQLTSQIDQEVNDALELMSQGVVVEGDVDE